jgi:hypothetical protein
VVRPHEVVPRDDITIGRDDVLTLRGDQRPVHDRHFAVVAAVGLPDVRDGKAQFLPQSADRFPCFIAGTVVGDDDLKVPGVLPGVAVQHYSSDRML